MQGWRGRAVVLRLGAIVLGIVLGVASPVLASTVAQNLSWTIDREGTTTKYRVVAYGDSIFAGYNGSISRVAIYAAPSVDAEYASNYWGTDVEVIRRTKSGAKAGDIYENKIVDDSSWMESPSTRIVTFEMCGNDGLQARTELASQNGTCDYSALNVALAECTEYLEKSMVFINATAHPNTVAKVVSNLYYPGYAADDVLTNCTDPQSGQKVNKQDVFLPYLARMNWRACNFADQYGFSCADTFARFMGSTYDSNGDNRRDTRALRFFRGESEDDYVFRLTTTLRETIRDANMHFVRPTTSFDYIQSDDTHPTFNGGTTYIGFLGGTGSGSSAPRFEPRRYRSGKNRVWKKFGHERMGHAMSVHNPKSL